MKKDARRTFLTVFILFSAGILSALALIPTGSRPNLLGNVGSFFAYTVYGSFGIGAWLFPVLFFYWGLARARGGEIRSLERKVFGLALFLVSLLVLLHLAFKEVPLWRGAEFTFGGKLGALCGEWMVSVFSWTGTAVVCLWLGVLALWFLEKEMHLLYAMRLSRKGAARAFLVSKNALRITGEKIRSLCLSVVNAWKTRQRRRREANEGRFFEREKSVLEKEIPPSLAPENPPEEKATKKKEDSFSEGVQAFDFQQAQSSPDSFGQEPLSVSSEREDLSEKKEGGSREAAPLKKTPAPREESPALRRLPSPKTWKKPDPNLLHSRAAGTGGAAAVEQVGERLLQTLRNFNVEARIVGVNPGPTVTQYEVQPAAGVKIQKIASLADDLALALSCGQVRVVAPLPGKSAVGVEVPNSESALVNLKELLLEEAFQKSQKPLRVALGREISGKPVFSDLDAMPHLLVAGATGSGKSVCLHTLLLSLLFHATPKEVRLVLVDPKRVELTLYRDIPHLALPVITDPARAEEAMRWLVSEMEERYGLLAKFSVRDIAAYNAKAAEFSGRGGDAPEALPYLLVIVDELADLMMTAKATVEDALVRLAQMARAVGIHLVLATQRPTVEVITGTLKANFPSRIAFQVFSKVDSRTILDTAGAEALLGKGDMLYLPSGAAKPLRLQGAYVSVEEVERVCAFWKAQGPPDYWVDLEAAARRSEEASFEAEDELYEEAVAVVRQAKQASTSLLQRRLRVGYSRAARLIDEMEARGVVGPADGNKPRKVYLNEEETASPEEQKEET